jgi:hypothetical protein
MQYITQCSRYPRVITTRSRENNYLLFQIVKEQPNRSFFTPEEAPFNRANPRARPLKADSSHRLFFAGGANRDRTGDLLLAKQALSQLSYGPAVLACKHRGAPSWLVGLDGFEPSTPALSRRCSNQLSYRPAWVACMCTAAAARDYSR